MKRRQITVSSVYEFEQLEEILATLGSQLRQLRQEQGLTLEYVATKLRIRQRLLVAIEEGRLEQLPEPVYVHYFLKRYGDLLGLDGESFARPFPCLSRFSFLDQSWMRLPSFQLRPVHLYLLYVGIIFASVNGLSSWMERSFGSSVGYLVQQSPSTTVAAIAPLPLPSPQSPAPVLAKTPLTENPEPVRVSLMVSDASWVRIEADGETAFEGTLKEGTEQTWVANQKLIILTGNAGGVSVALNEGKAKQLGELGAVEEVIFTAKAH